MRLPRWRPALSGAIVAASTVAACETVPYTGRSQLQFMSPQQESQLGVQAYQQTLAKAQRRRTAAPWPGSADRPARPTGFPPTLRRAGWSPGSAAASRLSRATPNTSGSTGSFRTTSRRMPSPCPAARWPSTRASCRSPATKAGSRRYWDMRSATWSPVMAASGSASRRSSQQTLANVGLETTMAALSSGNPATVQAVASLLGAGATVGVLLPWSRAQESEADHIGLILMAKAGYDPHAARDLWLRMAAASRGSGRPAEVLSTHPSEPTRIQQIEAWIPEAMQSYRLH